MTTLSVNINKLATLRNSRGGNNPNVLQWALDIISYGAEGITVHPRPDGRHIRRDDVYEIARTIEVEFNIEGFPDKDFVKLAKEVNPAQCTLVPDPPHVLTSNAGWQVEKHVSFLKEVIKDLHKSDIRTSLFIDPFAFTAKDLEALKVTGADRVELYTEAYSTHYGTASAAETLAIYQRVAEDITKEGIELNAGHDLNLDNLKAFLKAIPNIKEVSIGHALVCDALRFGMKETVKRYLECLR